MICANCATENETGRKFCLECGAVLAAACPACGAANAPGAKFCGECGSALGERPPAATAAPASVAAGATATAPAPVAERRLVSVLFADLVGFTTLAEGRDPEDTRELLSRYFGLARHVIVGHGGTVEKFIGDAVMAVWGAPVAHEDDAERAVRAGLELVSSVVTLGPGVEARAGVATGEAAVTIGATGEGMVAGDLVNTASRLQSVAPPGTVLVGESTERAASRAIAFEAVGDQELRGKSLPVSAFKALRVVAEIGGRNRAQGLEGPFVGRDHELRLLKDLFHATGRDGRPRLVSVVGPGGIGKSRLAWEFSKYSDGLVEDTWWHSGRSPAYGEGISFWALGEMVRRRAGLLESDDEATTRQKVGETAERWASDDDERRWFEAALLALLGLGEPLPGGRDELFAAWRTFFERIAAHGTTVLVFEDLQWADMGLLDFIDHLLDWTKALPIFVITLARPELLERRPEWGAGRRNFVALALEPLPVEAMRELLAGLVPGLDSNVVSSIIARADGIPLYAVETVRMLVSEGRLREEQGAYRPVGDLRSLAIPETLTALIAARLDGLEAAERALLQDAAVLGQSFTLAGLSAVSGQDQGTLEPLLRGLVRRELLTLNADPRSPERGQYGFVQGLIREVAYNQLARPDRKARHLAAARWFESLGDDELAGALAGQYASAYRNAPAGPEADALATQARIALRGAADRAAALGSHAQAVAFLQQALDISSDPPDRAALLERIGTEAVDGGIVGVAQPALEAALSLYRELGDRLGVARAATGLSLLFHERLRPADAIPIIEAAVAGAAGLENEPDVVRLLAEQARAYANTRDPRALDTADRVIELAERLELMPIIAEALINRALVLTYAGRFYEPNAILRGMLPIAKAHGLVRAHIRALNNLASAGMDDDIRMADEMTHEAIDLSRRMGAQGWLTYFQTSDASNELMLGNWQATERILTELEETELTGGVVIDFLLVNAVFRACRGEEEKARAALGEVRPLIAKLSHRNYAAVQMVVEAEVAALGGRLDEAYRLGMEGVAVPSSVVGASCAEWAGRAAIWMGDLDRARAALAAHSDQFNRGRAISATRRQLAAGVAALEGRRADALSGYRDAVARWRELDIPHVMGHCLIEFAISLGPDEPEAAAAAEEARALYTRLGSPPLLARLDEGLARWKAGVKQHIAGATHAVRTTAPG